MIINSDAKNYEDPYNLINIADFNSLIAQSQINNTPVFLLTKDQVNRLGNVWDNMKNSIDDITDKIYDQLGVDNIGRIKSAY